MPWHVVFDHRGRAVPCEHRSGTRFVTRPHRVPRTSSTARSAMPCVAHSTAGPYPLHTGICMPCTPAPYPSTCGLLKSQCLVPRMRQPLALNVHWPLLLAVRQGPTAISAALIDVYGADLAELYLAATCTALQRRGYGSVMVRELETRLREAGVSGVLLFPCGR